MKHAKALSVAVANVLAVNVLAGCSTGLSSGQLSYGTVLRPSKDVPTQVIYRIDDHRFISLENYDMCFGDTYYNDTHSGIHTKVGVTAPTDFQGRLVIDDPSGMNVAIPTTHNTSCSDRGCRDYMAYSTDRTKTAMPEGEQLGDLARHRATMPIHLGVRHLARIVDELLPHYGAQCPVAVIYRASWPDEERVIGPLADIVGKVGSTQIERTALILVGQVLAAQGFAESTLYGKAG